MSSSNVQLLVCVALGLVPAAYQWWALRRVARRPEDPLSAERYLASQRIVGQMCGVAVVVGIIVGSGGRELVTLGSLTAGLLLASYPTRHTLWGETRGFFAFASQTLRGFVAHFGFWLLLGLGPLVSMRLPGSTPLKTILFFAVMASWVALGARPLIALQAGRPLADQSLLARFREIAARSTVAMPEVLQIGFPGGTLANAFALWSRRQSRVLLGRTLLDVLTPEETAAIFAHEQAHLEQYSAGEARQLTRLVWGLMIAAAAVLYAADRMPIVLPVGLLWFVAAVTFWGRIMRSHKRHEVAGDRRAVELCGDASAYASALVKLHTFMRTPRRWAADFERVASHPSLARRLATIRGSSPSDGRVPVVVVADRGLATRRAVLDGQGCRCFTDVEEPGEPDAVPATGTLVANHRYEELVELLVTAGPSATPSLVVRPKDGRGWSMKLRAEDAPRVQAQLDRVDHRLAVVAGGRRPVRLRPVLIFVSGTLLTALALTLYDLVTHRRRSGGVSPISRRRRGV